MLGPTNSACNLGSLEPLMPLQILRTQMAAAFYYHSDLGLPLTCLHSQVFVGNPGKVHHYRFNEDQIESLQRIKWWEWDDPTIRARIEDFKDINVFIEKYDNKSNS